MKITKGRYASGVVLLLLIFLGLIYWALVSGSTAIQLTDIKGLLQGRISPSLQVIITLRLPRIVIALLAGIALAISTVLLQIVTKNPLAEAGLLGIASGAEFGYLLVVLFFPTAFQYAPIVAIVMAMFTCLFLLQISSHRQMMMAYFLIAGIAIQAMFSSLTKLLSQVYRPTNGLSVTPTLGMKNWEDVLQMTWPILLLVLAVIVMIRWCERLQLDDQTLRSLGVQVSLWQGYFLLIAVALAAITTAYIGVVAFLGLLATHLAKRLVGDQPQRVLPIAALVGASLLIMADTIGRTWFLPAEIAANQLLALIGAPVLLYLVARKDGVIWKSKN